MHLPHTPTLLSHLSTLTPDPATAIPLLLSLYGIFVKAACSLQCYQSQACVSHLHSLPRAHFHSGLVQGMLGRCYCEQGEYKSCVLALKAMVRAERHRVQGLEILSTAYWHLKRDKELCSLAQHVCTCVCMQL